MLRELRHALRSLRSWRFGAMAAVLTLAIGIGTATSMYALVRTAVNSATPDIENLPALGRIYASSRALGIERAQLTLKDVDLLTTASSFDSVGAYASGESDMTAGPEPLTVSVGEVSAGFFGAMRAHAAAGRLLSANDFGRGAQVAVVSDAIWRTHFAGRSLSNAVVTIDGTPRTVVGVLPANFGFSFIGIDADVWTPMSRGRDAAERRVAVLARLKPGVTWSAASAELDALARPQNPNGLWTWSAITLEQDVKKRTVGGFAMLFGPALVVLLIGCVNVACMLLARGIERDTELSVRAALGASRGTMFRQLLIENLVLASLGGIGGTAVAMGLMRLLASSVFAAAKPSIAAQLSGDLTLLPVAVASTALACLLFGTIPALRLSRRDVSASLKGVASPSRVRVAGYGARDLVVFAELGLAVVLVVVTAMYFSFFSALQQTKVLFAADEVIAVPIASRDLAVVSERVSALPGVERIAIASALPGGPRSLSVRTRTLTGRVLKADLITADDAFFATIEMPIVRGRSFDRAEATANAPVAVVSESAARMLWPDTDAIGQPLEVSAQGADVHVTVIGVARDTVDHAVLGVQPAAAYPRSRWASAATVYRPLDIAASREYGLLVRTRNARAMLRSVAAAARPSAAARMPHAVVVGEQIGQVPAEATGLIRLFGGFALIAMLLAASGIFGVIGQSVVQRTREFGVRIALGATQGRVLRMVLMREGKLIAAALFAGSVGALAVMGTLMAELVWISAMNPMWPITLIALCGFVAALGCGMATHRIVRLDPWVVLRRS